MNGYETPSTVDSLDFVNRYIVDDFPEVLDSGLSKRPPFLETVPKGNLGGFIDEGNATLLRDDFSICCEAYFHWRHKLEYSPDGEHPERESKRVLSGSNCSNRYVLDVREKLRQHSRATLHSDFVINSMLTTIVLSCFFRIPCSKNAVPLRN